MRKDDNLLLAAGVPVAFRDKIKFTYPTGSSYTCNPPVTDTDVDFYVLMRNFHEEAQLEYNRQIQSDFSYVLNNLRPAAPLLSNAVRLSEIRSYLVSEGWSECLSEQGRHAYANTPGHQETWEAFRRGDFNMIVVVDEDHFYRCAAATELCKAENALSKDRRIEIHTKVHINPGKHIPYPSNYATSSVVQHLRAHKLW
ncbi:nucleotidyltransferase domain-containing protein [Stenotrophomonas phage StenR_269]|nr:nucleotidyltransferase domain-containing protein [Stenotrophomonas phage StenR_269]